MAIILKKRGSIVIPSGEHEIIYTNNHAYVTTVGTGFDVVDISNKITLSIVYSNSITDITTSHLLLTDGTGGSEYAFVIGTEEGVKAFTAPESGIPVFLDSLISNAVSDKTTNAITSHNGIVNTMYINRDDGLYETIELNGSSLSNVSQTATTGLICPRGAFTTDPDYMYQFFISVQNETDTSSTIQAVDTTLTLPFSSLQAYYNAVLLKDIGGYMWGFLVGNGRLTVFDPEWLWSFGIFSVYYDSDSGLTGFQKPFYKDPYLYVPTATGIVIYKFDAFNFGNLYPTIDTTYNSIGKVDSIYVDGNYLYATKSALFSIYEILESTPTTTTTTPTTTTTTTTLPARPEALKKVETVAVSSNNISTGNDGSDSKGTLNTIDSMSISFGPLAPGETSETKIIFLRVPFARTIGNIKIALLESEGIIFANNVFGVEIKDYIDYNIVPSTYFQGLNEDNLPNNVNNIDVGNNSPLTSKYVYLNVTLPEGQELVSGTISMKWYFDYA